MSVGCSPEEVRKPESLIGKDHLQPLRPAVAQHICVVDVVKLRQQGKRRVCERSAAHSPETHSEVWGGRTSGL